MEDKILFYGPNWFYSNFSPHRVFWQGEVWATAEHGYQAYKYFGVRQSHVFIYILNAHSPEEAKEIGREYKVYRRPDWNEIKLDIMEQIVRRKFAQHPRERLKVLATGLRELIEDSPKDGYWGRGPDWNGLNHLGEIWMKVRDQYAFYLAARRLIIGQT